MATSSTAHPLPCLVFEHGDAQRATTVYSVSDGTHRPGNGGIGNKRSWVASHGWVLVWDPATLATYLWRDNNDKIQLPSLVEPPAKAGCVLSASPTDPAGCTVLLTHRFSNLMWYCRVGDLSSAGSEWVRHEYDVGSVRVPADYAVPAKRVMYRPASWRGKFYYQRSCDEIGVLEFSPATGAPVFSILPMKGVELVPDGGHVAAASPYLLDLDGDLYMVYIFFHNVDFNVVADVGVYRLDFERNEAVRVDAIGDRAILVGSKCSFAGWCPASTFGLVPNCVYWMSPHDGCLHVYDLQHKTDEVRDPHDGVAKQPSTSFWMIPPHT